jgi:hypothetical protein
MKIKLVQPGYENFTGHMGQVNFTNGISDVDLSVEQQATIAAIYQIDEWNGTADVGPLSVTNDQVNVEDTTGDFNAATAPAPSEPV